MKATMLKAGVVAIAATVGTSILGGAPTQAATFTTTNCDFLPAVTCTDLLSGNDSVADLNNVTGELSPFSGINWKFLSKIELSSTDTNGDVLTPNEGVTSPTTFTLALTNGQKGGLWEAIQTYLGNTPFVLAMKAGNNHAYNYFDGTVFSGTWDTDRFVNRRNIPQDLSHASLYVPDDFTPPTPVPTPALLPGLVGLGVAALRKKKQAAEATQDA
jgi:hypothetical protein